MRRVKVGDVVWLATWTLADPAADHTLLVYPRKVIAAGQTRASVAGGTVHTYQAKLERYTPALHLTPEEAVEAFCREQERERERALRGATYHGDLLARVRSGAVTIVPREKAR